MSPWPREEMRVLLCPEQVTLLSVQRTLTLHGVSRTFHGARTLSCTASSGPRPWQAALAALATALPATAKGRSEATVILSNQFLRYVLVPWRAELQEGLEDMSYVRHCFTRVYGKCCLEWELRLARQAPGLPRLASAMDADLLAGLRSAFDQAGVRVRSIQPHLMAAFNEAGRRLRHRSAWLALVEPGHLCVAMLHQGQWSRVHGLRIRQSWAEELLPLLERECFLADDDLTGLRDVYVATLDGAGVALPELAAWRFHALTSTPVGVAAAGAGSRLTLATSAG